MVRRFADPAIVTGTFAFYRVNRLSLLARTSNGQIRGPLIYFLLPYSSPRPSLARPPPPRDLAYLPPHSNAWKRDSLFSLLFGTPLNPDTRARGFILPPFQRPTPRPNRTIGEPRDLPRFVYDRARGVLFGTTITGEKLKLTFRAGISRVYRRAETISLPNLGRTSPAGNFAVDLAEARSGAGTNARRSYGSAFLFCESISR